MENIFSLNTRHSVTTANFNYYAFPFVHPKRKMEEHDFIYMIKGEWKFGQNKETYELKDDRLLILPAGMTHFGISPCSPNTKTMYFHVSMEKGDLSEITKENAVTVKSLTDASRNKQIKRIFSNIVNSKLSGNQLKADIYFDLLLCELSESNRDIAENSIPSKIKNTIHSNPEKFFSNKELAEMNNVSVKTAENKFKEIFEIPIHQYILNFKTEEAITYFEKFPEISIKEVAFNLGFYDEYHFSKQFKKIMGVSPKAYRKSRNI